MLLLPLLLSICSLFATRLLAERKPPNSPIERITVKRDGAEQEFAGKLLVDAETILLLQTADGRLWEIKPAEVVKREKAENHYRPLTVDEMEKQLATELPGFHFHRTEHFLIAYKTSKAYAEWCGGLFERLYTGFYDYWADREIQLQEPDAPLVAVIFPDQKSYIEYGKAEVGEGVALIQGHYGLFSNRVVMYDLTGSEGAGLGERKGMSARINAILSRPGAEGTVATIIHEATHQLAFNSGMHQRLSAIPRWLSEGMAIYFETPDLKNARGWKAIGVVNKPRLQTFQQYLRERPADSLATLIASDARTTDAKTARAAYAEAWALNYFLIKTRQEQYKKYLETLAAKEPLFRDSPEERLKDFQDAFGEDLGKLDAAFVKYMLKVK